jgi:hypothetical protein
LSAVRERLGEGLRLAAFKAIGRLREAVSRAWYRFAAPRSIEQVSRKDVRPMFLWVRAQEYSGDRSWRPDYAFGMLSAAWIASGHGIGEISALEFGVAGGTGLLAMERIAGQVESLLGVRIQIYGFDTGTGMPPAVDYRDGGFSLAEGTCDMDVDRLKARLQRAELMLGDVADTVPRFLEGDYAPVGFISNEIDYYSATMKTFAVLDAPPERLLPRVPCHFSSLMWHPWTEALSNGAAINDFNASHERRQLAPIRGLRYEWLPRSEFRKRWPDKMYVAEIFDHPRYSAPQGVPALDQTLVE